MTIAAQPDCADDCIAGNETGTKTEPKELAHMKTLTKSLHTVTAATNVARYLATERLYICPKQLARQALIVLDYRMHEFSEDDPTVAKIVRECARVIGERARVAA